MSTFKQRVTGEADAAIKSGDRKKLLLHYKSVCDEFELIGTIAFRERDRHNRAELYANQDALVEVARLLEEKLVNRDEPIWVTLTRGMKAVTP